MSISLTQFDFWSIDIGASLALLPHMPYSLPQNEKAYENHTMFFLFWPFAKMLSHQDHGVGLLYFTCHKSSAHQSTSGKINIYMHPLYRVVFQNAIPDVCDLSFPKPKTQRVISFEFPGLFER
jgi:hypothetical protein